MLHHMLRAAAGNRGGIPTDGLVACYTMDNISGSTLVDEQGAHNGTISGATQTTGIIGQALNFDGNDNVDLGATPALYTGAQSHSFWFYSTDAGRSLLTAGDSRDSLSKRGFDLFGNGTNLIWLLSDGSSILANANAAYPSLNAWHHCVLSWDGTTGAGSFKIHIDNSLFASDTPSGTDIADTFNFYIGGGQRQESEFRMIGSEDQYRIYNRALTTGEIDQLYNEVA